MFSDDVISRVRDSVDIVELISGYVTLRKTGRNHVGLCPFHSEKTPSFNVNPEKQIFHCFGCGAGGDAFKFLELHEGMSFPDAVRLLAGRAGITLPEIKRNRGADQKAEDERKLLLAITAEAAAYYREELAGPAGAAARAYLTRRGVDDRIVQEFGLGFSRPEWDGVLRRLTRKGYSPAQIERAGLAVRRSEGDGHYDRFRGRLMFPIRDLSGNVIAFGGRVMDDGLPKYLNSSETPLYSKSNTLYCLDAAKDQGRKQGYFIVVEGYLDALACHQHGIRNAVAALGTALTEGHLRLMRRFAQKLVLIFDPDPAGVKAALRGTDLFAASAMKVNVVSLPDGDDPDTFLQKHGKEAFAERLRSSAKFMDFVLAQVTAGGTSLPVDDKVTKAGEMLRIIAKLPSGIERDLYLKKTAEALDLDETVLRQEMPRVHRQDPAPAPAAPRSVRPKAEETLIHLMLRDPAIALHLREELGPDDFTDPLLRRAADRIFAAVAASGTVDARALTGQGDEELDSLLLRLSVLDAEWDDLEKSCQDCVSILRQRDPEKQMRQIVKALTDAYERQDHDEYKRLLELQQELSRRPGRRIPGL